MLKKLVLDTLTLQTPKGRFTAWAILTTAIYFSKFSWLEHLSLLQRLGFENAPSIGLTRSYWLLMHEGAGAAWQMNPLIFIVLAIGLPLLAIDLFRLVKTTAG